MPSRMRALILGLVLVILASSCSPLAGSQATPLQKDATVVPAPGSPAPARDTLAPADSEVLPIATSRGADLEATDPATVSLASGGLQLVEFFRFT